MSRPANAAGFLIHSAVHKARPDVVAACHTHSPAGKAWSAFARPLEMLNQDVTYFYGEAQAVYEVRFFFSSVSLSFFLVWFEEGEREKEREVEGIFPFQLLIGSYRTLEGWSSQKKKVRNWLLLWVLGARA